MITKLSYPRGTLYDAVAAAAKKFPGKVSYEFMGLRRKYADFLGDIERCARSLVALDVKADDVVCISMPNVPQAITFFYAVNRIGAIANMIHPLSSEPEMKSFLTRVGAKVMIVMDQFYPAIDHIRAETSLQHIVVASVADALSLPKKIGFQLTQGKKIAPVTEQNGVILWRNFLKLAECVSDLPTIGDRTEECAVILHSGGTTGKIKGVCLSNLSINACSAQMLDFNPMISSDDKMLSVMPIFHGNGLVIGVHTMLSIGARCVLIPRFTPETYAKDLIRHRCNYMSGVPTLFERLMDVPAMKDADLSFLKGVFSGADYLSVELERRINRFLDEHHSPVRVRQGYGMTEGVVASTLNPVEGQCEGSIGLALPDVSVKIVTPGTTEEVPVGETGEICMSSLTNMMYYYNDPEETAIALKVHSDGLSYIHSGDLGYMDENGFVFFKGRIKRMIVTNGYNVFPMELENIIEANELVDRCCVLGVPDKERIEAVKAFIVLVKGVEPSEETKKQLIDYCRTNIARYAVPRQIEFIPELPKTKVGKVDFNALLRADAEKNK